MVGPEMPEVLVDLMETYLEESAGLVKTIREALTAGDLQSALRPAHSLKSSSASIGALELTARCGELETAARGAAGGTAPPEGMATRTLASIGTEYNRVRGALASLSHPG